MNKVITCASSEARLPRVFFFYMSRSSATWCNTWYTGQRLRSKVLRIQSELNKIKSIHILSTSWHKYTLLERLVLCLNLAFKKDLKLEDIFRIFQIELCMSRICVSNSTLESFCINFFLFLISKMEFLKQSRLLLSRLMLYAGKTNVLIWTENALAADCANKNLVLKCTRGV